MYYLATQGCKFCRGYAASTGAYGRHLESLRGTTVRSGLNGVFGPRAPSNAIDSGVRLNASSALLSMATACSMVRARTTLSSVLMI